MGRDREDAIVYTVSIVVIIFVVANDIRAEQSRRGDGRLVEDTEEVSQECE